MARAQVNGYCQQLLRLRTLADRQSAEIKPLLAPSKDLRKLILAQLNTEGLLSCPCTLDNVSYVLRSNVQPSFRNIGRPERETLFDDAWAHALRQTQVTPGLTTREGLVGELKRYLSEFLLDNWDRRLNTTLTYKRLKTAPLATPGTAGTPKTPDTPLDALCKRYLPLSERIKAIRSGYKARRKAIQGLVNAGKTQLAQYVSSAEVTLPLQIQTGETRYVLKHTVSRKRETDSHRRNVRCVDETLGLLFSSEWDMGSLSSDSLRRAFIHHMLSVNTPKVVEKTQIVLEKKRIKK
jgi:hypothetical protein